MVTVSTLKVVFVRQVPFRSLRSLPYGPVYGKAPLVTVTLWRRHSMPPAGEESPMLWIHTSAAPRNSGDVG